MEIGRTIVAEPEWGQFESGGCRVPGVLEALLTSVVTVVHRWGLSCEPRDQWHDAA